MVVFYRFVSLFIIIVFMIISMKTCTLAMTPGSRTGISESYKLGLAGMLVPERDKCGW